MRAIMRIKVGFTMPHEGRGTFFPNRSMGMGVLCSVLLGLVRCISLEEVPSPPIEDQIDPYYAPERNKDWGLAHKELDLLGTGQCPADISPVELYAHHGKFWGKLCIAGSSCVACSSCTFFSIRRVSERENQSGVSLGMGRI